MFQREDAGLLKLPGGVSMGASKLPGGLKLPGGTSTFAAGVSLIADLTFAVLALLGEISTISMESLVASLGLRDTHCARGTSPVP